MSISLKTINYSNFFFNFDNFLFDNYIPFLQLLFSIHDNLGIIVKII